MVGSFCSIFQILQSDLNTKIFEDLLQFTGSSHVGFSTERTSGFVQEIPTAALVTGTKKQFNITSFNRRPPWQIG